jgi:protein-tyrosine phosphatase
VTPTAPFAAGRIDLHLHVLPGLDDGARDDDAAMDMLRGLQAAGFSRLVATPHADDSRYTYGHERIEAARAALESRARAAGLTIGLGCGAEYAYGARFHDELAARRLMTLDGSRYVLLELPEAFMPAAMPNVLFEVGAAGYYPIVAHPERCQPFHDDLERLLSLTTGRALIQVSFRSLAGTFGRTIKKTAWALVEGGHADLVATDCHSPRELPKIVHPVLAELEARLPPRRLQQLLSATPNRLIAAA